MRKTTHVHTQDIDVDYSVVICLLIFLNAITYTNQNPIISWTIPQFITLHYIEHH